MASTNCTHSQTALIEKGRVGPGWRLTVDTDVIPARQVEARELEVNAVSADREVLEPVTPVELTRRTCGDAPTFRHRDHRDAGERLSTRITNLPHKAG